MRFLSVSAGVRNRSLTALVVCGAIAAAGSVWAAEQEPATTGGQASMLRLSPEQYRLSVLDVFGSTIKVGGRFEPDLREAGLIAVGASRVSVSASGLEQYNSSADNVAAQVVSEKRRGTLIPCKPAADNAADDACATKFLSEVGRLLFRRPLTPLELRAQVQVASSSAAELKSFYTGLGVSLANLLVAPPFLFRQVAAEPDPEQQGQYRLDGYSKATQLSFLLWNTTPDPELLAAAERGDLHTEKGLTAQVDRLLASPRLESGVRAFFIDMLGFDEFVALTKDATIYPKFTFKVNQQTQEQTLRTIVDLLLTQRGDYRDLFTTRKTFLTPTLASLYRVPLSQETPNGSTDIWHEYEYPPNDPRAGILTHASFVALHSHPGRTSVTLRGKALRQAILCQKVPDPPGNVDFAVVQDTKNPIYKTARERVTAHRTQPVCAGCHKIMDPLGLGLENFDSSGAYRANENDTKIDASGELDGFKFTDAAGLGKAVHDSPAAASCVISRVFSYGTGRPVAPGEADWMKYVEKGFAADGYKLPALLRRIATSDAFYRVLAPQTRAADASETKLASQTNSPQESRK